MDNFIVLTSRRSGSTWLVDVLNHVEGITAYAELMRPTKKAKRPAMSAKTIDYFDKTLRAYLHFHLTDYGKRPFSVFKYLDDLYSQPGAITFKILYYHLVAYPEVWAYMVWRRLPVIHLVRQNHLNVVISTEMSRMTKVLHRTAVEANVETPQLTLNPERLIQQMRKLQRNINLAQWLLRFLRLPHIEIIYEDLVHDPANFAPVWHFLGINQSDQPIQSSLTKLVRGSHAEIIDNYDEVKAALSQTEFASLLN